MLRKSKNLNLALAAGWVKGGRAGARETLSSFWEAVGSCNHPLTSGAGASTQLMLDLSRLFSPYQLNPFDINPLLKRLNFHLIEADDLIGKMRVEKTLNADLAFLLKLKEEGRTRAEIWLEQSAGLLGRRSSVDLNTFV